MAAFLHRKETWQVAGVRQTVGDSTSATFDPRLLKGRLNVYISKMARKGKLLSTIFGSTGVGLRDGSKPKFPN
jgi:hypothetical protein